MSTDITNLTVNELAVAYQTETLAKGILQETWNRGWISPLKHINEAKHQELLENCHASRATYNFAIGQAKAMYDNFKELELICKSTGALAPKFIRAGSIELIKLTQKYKYIDSAVKPPKESTRWKPKLLIGLIGEDLDKAITHNAKLNHNKARWQIFLSQVVSHYSKPISKDKEGNYVYKELSHTDWMHGLADKIGKGVFQTACQNAEKAMENFFKHKSDFPVFKTRKKSGDSFQTVGKIVVTKRAITIPILGKFKLANIGYIPVGIYNKVTVRWDIDQWIISVAKEITNTAPVKSINKITGVDLGLKTLAATENKLLKGFKRCIKTEHKRIFWQRKLARAVKGSNKYNKAKLKVGLYYKKARNQREHILHTISKMLTDENQVLVIEHLNILGMMQNRKLARSFGEAGLGELVRQLTYKAKQKGRTLIQANRWFASTQILSDSWVEVMKTGQIGRLITNNDLHGKPLVLSDREVTLCNNSVIDRDVNASLNLKSLYLFHQKWVKAEVVTSA